MPEVQSRTVLAFDFGAKRIGVAVGEELAGSARPLAVVKVRDGRPDWDALSALIKQWQPDCFVAGLPGTDDGSPHELAPRISRFARQLEGRFGRPVEVVDERLSSYAAHNEAGPQADAVGLDAVAARMILETWFQQQ